MRLVATHGSERGRINVARGTTGRRRGGAGGGGIRQAKVESVFGHTYCYGKVHGLVLGLVDHRKSFGDPPRLQLRRTRKDVSEVARLLMSQGETTCRSDDPHRGSGERQKYSSYTHGWHDAIVVRAFNPHGSSI